MGNTIKVDLLYSGYLSSPNGASMFVKKMEGLKEKFAENGVELRVISQDLIKQRTFNDSEEIRKRVSIREKVFALAKYSVMLTKLIIHITDDKYSKLILDYYDKMEDKADVVAFQEASCCYHYLKRRSEKNQKIFLTMHNSGEIWSMWYIRLPRLRSRFFKHYRKDFEQTLFGGCDKIGFVADLPRKKFVSLYPYEDAKTYYVYNGIEVKKIPIRDNSETLDLISVGSLCDRKNQIGILNAIGMLSEDYQRKITMTFVGDGSARQELENKAKELLSKVIFTGSTKEVARYLSMANCFVLFSKDEGLPISIIEGMRAGLPVIGTNIAGIPEQIVDGMTGFLVDVNERQLAERMMYIVDHLDHLSEMGAASYQLFLEKFTIDAMIKKYAEIYKS